MDASRRLKMRMMRKENKRNNPQFGTKIV